MKVFSILLFFFLFFDAKNSPATQTYQVVVQPGSVFKIRGTSNISSFDFVYNKQLNSPRNIRLEKEINKPNVFGDNKIALQVADFKTSNSLMLKEFRKMLKSEAYPDLNIEVVRLFPKQDNLHALYAMTIISIAGAKRLEIVQFRVQQTDETLQCTSSHVISLKNYNIEAPQKLMGFVSVKDEVVVDLFLNLTYHKT